MPVISQQNVLVVQLHYACNSGRRYQSETPYRAGSILQVLYEQFSHSRDQ